MRTSNVFEVCPPVDKEESSAFTRYRKGNYYHDKAKLRDYNHNIVDISKTRDGDALFFIHAGSTTLNIEL